MENRKHGSRAKREPHSNADHYSSSDSFTSTDEGYTWSEVRLIGSGGFGNVSLWQDKSGNQMVVKECRIPTHVRHNMEERWHNEIQLLRKLSHPNITVARHVTETEFARSLSFPYLCMEYCDGGDLRQVLRIPENCCGLEESQIRAICSDLAEGIKFLHEQKVVHRDLKPENILLKQLDCDKVVYKLTDFGYAKEYDQSSMCTSFVGTMQYVAPEILQNLSYNKDVDFWSFGIVIFECITGRRPFLPGDSPMQWLVAVEKKKSEHISVEWADDGTNNVKYSEKLPPPHRLSRVFEEGITRWLRLMLQWNPQERGGREVSPGQREWFDRLQEILLTKAVTVVIMSSGKTFTYPVKNTDTYRLASTINGVAKDTGIPVDKQSYLYSNGTVVSSGDNQRLCLNKEGDDGSHGDVLYMFADDTQTSIRLADQGITTSNKLINQLISDPDNQMRLSDRRRCYAVLYFVLRERATMFSDLLTGQRAITTHLDKLRDDWNTKMSSFHDDHTRAVAKLEMFRSISSSDKEALKRLIDSDRSSLPQSSALRVLSSQEKREKEAITISQELVKLSSEADRFQEDYDKLRPGVDHNNDAIATLLTSFYDDYVAKGLESYSEAKYADKIGDLPDDDVNTTSKLLISSVDHCSQLIDQFNNSVAIVTITQFNRLLAQLKKLQEKLTQQSTMLDSLQQRGQAEIWQLMEQCVNSQEPQQVSSISPDPLVSSPDPLMSSQSQVDQQTQIGTELESDARSEVEESLKMFISHISVDHNDGVINANDSLLQKLLATTDPLDVSEENKPKVYRLFSEELVAMEADNIHSSTA